LKEVLRRQGRFLRYHARRHFGSSLLEQANVPIGSIQRILGHENRLTTETTPETRRQVKSVPVALSPASEWRWFIKAFKGRIISRE
jgi:integrase